MAGGTEHEVISLGRFRPREVPCDDLGVGQVGYVTANIKQLSDVRIGDTITDAHRPGHRGPARLPGAGAGRLLRPLPGHAQPVRGPADGPPEALAQRRQLHLRARDRPTPSGFGFRCGFLGMLHMEIVQQRLERESNLSLVQTAPNVTYEIVTKQGRDPPHLQPDPDPRPRRHRGVPRAGRPGQLHPPVGLHRRDHAALRGPPGDLPQDRVHDPHPRHPRPTSCRWPR